MPLGCIYETFCIIYTTLELISRDLAEVEQWEQP